MDKNIKYAIWVIFLSYISVMTLIIIGMKEPNVSINNEEIVFSGIYGETLPFSKFKKVELVDETPEIKSRRNGLSMGSVKRGYYITREKRRVKLLLFNRKPPYLMIELNSNFKIFYNSKKHDIDSIFQEILHNLER